MDRKRDFTGRTKMVTIHLPIELGILANIMGTLADTMGAVPLDSVMETDREHVTFYAPDGD